MRRPCKYNIIDIESITCPYCKKDGFKMLHWGHLKKLHNKTMNDVNNEFPNIPTMTKQESDKRSEVRIKCDQKVKETCNIKYGGVGFKSKILEKKSRDEMENKYGERNIMKIDKYKNLFVGDKNPMKNKEIAKKSGDGHRGKPSKLKGKTYKKIHGEKKAKQLIEAKRISGAIACSKCINPSVPQIKLYELTKEIYPNAIMNDTIGWYCVDITIPDKKIAIEYDGSYWHQDKKKDSERQKNLEKMGWKFIRYIDKLPTLNQLSEDINNI